MLLHKTDEGNKPNHSHTSTAVDETLLLILHKYKHNYSLYSALLCLSLKHRTTQKLSSSCEREATRTRICLVSWFSPPRISSFLVLLHSHVSSFICGGFSLLAVQFATQDNKLIIALIHSSYKAFY